MSSLSVIEMFSLANGHCEQISSSSTKSTKYIVYDSSISCPDDTEVDLQICHFSSKILPDNTVTLIVRKVAFPCCTSVSPHLGLPHGMLLKSNHALFCISWRFIIRGIQQNILHPMVFGIGHVSNIGHFTEASRTFTISTSSYISGTSIPSSIKYNFYFL